MPRIAIDARIARQGGIARVTTNIIEGLLSAESKADRYILITDDRGGTHLPDLRDRTECVVHNATPLSPDDLTRLPILLGAIEADLFLTTQVFASPFVSCPTIRMVHDLGILLHPEWAPSLHDIREAYGVAALDGIAMINDHFLALFRAGRILPGSTWLANALACESMPATHSTFAGMFALTCHSADRLIAPSFHTRSELASTFGVEGKTSVVPNHCDPVFHHRIGSKENFVLHVSKWEPWKNMEGLLAGFQLFNRDHREFRLVLVGVSGVQSELARSVREQAGPISDVVVFKGAVDDLELSDLYRRAAALAFPSHYEGFGLPVVEAMASGTPVVSSNAAALPETCGGAALLVNPQRPSELASALERIVTQDSERERLQAAGLHRSSAFRRGSSTRRLLSVMKEVLSQ